MIMCGILEYFTSLIMEKLFNARWWDYSDQKFNINGRICLETIVWFGFAGIGIILIFNPLFIKAIELMSPETMNIVFYVLATVFFVDVIISLNVMTKIKHISKDISRDLKDNTEEISKKIRETILEKSMPYRRILEAFPSAFADKVKSSKDKIVHAASELKSNVIEVKDKAVENIGNVKDKAVENIGAVKDKTIESIGAVKEKAQNSVNTIKQKAKRKNIEGNTNENN